MSAARAAGLLAEALMVDVASIGGHTALGASAEWDSMAHMRLVLALEAVLARELSADEVLAVSDFDAVAALLVEPPRG